MSILGDRLRKAAKEADANEKLVAFAAVVTENSTLRVLTDKPEDEDEARALTLRTLLNLSGVDYELPHVAQQRAIAASLDDSPIIEHEAG